MNLLVYITTVISLDGSFVLNSSHEHNRLVSYTFVQDIQSSIQISVQLKPPTAELPLKHVLLPHLQT